MCIVYVKCFETVKHIMSYRLSLYLIPVVISEGPLTRLMTFLVTDVRIYLATPS